MAASAIDEALRQIVSVGGDIERCAILDNFCWGNTNKPEKLGDLVRAARACYNIAKGYEVPFISGKDSLNNEYSTGRKTISIPPTLLISCIAVMEDVAKAISMDTKRPGNAIYIVGLTYDEMGGSQYYKLRGFLGNSVPKVNPEYGRRLMRGLTRAIEKGYVISCHDCSDGGMAVALSEMAFAGGFGMEVRLGEFKPPQGQKMLRQEVLLFSESNTRFIVEVDDETKFIQMMKGLPMWKLGHVVKGRTFKIFGSDEKLAIGTDIDNLKSHWQSPFENI